MTKTDVITTWENSKLLSEAAAHLFVADCQAAIATTGRFTVALSGGNTPRELYSLLAQPHFSNNIPWKKVFLFWSDERFVPHNDRESNFRMVKESLLSKIKIPSKNIFSMPVKGDPAACARQYEETMRTFFGNKPISFDWMMLGMGDDGHTASLFPGTTILAEKKKLVSEVWVPEKETWRLSFTLPLINQSKKVVFLVAGDSKTTVLRKVMKPGNRKNKYPVEMVQPVKGIRCWLLDYPAAGLQV